MIRSTLVLAFIFVVMPSAPSLADVKVTYVNPESYRDRDFRSTRKRASILTEFDRYFEQLGERYLGKGQVLKVEILDIDLAGRYEPWQPRFYDVRILRGTTPPRIKLRYELRYKGKKVSEGEETISDLNYLMNTPARLSSKRFAYEKHMLRHWFRKRFSS